MIHVFISYKREEQAIAEQVYQWLAGHGYRPWMDVHNIPAGAESWADEIEKGLQNADVVLGLMSRRSIASVNVKNEWDYTIVNGKKHATRLVLVKLDDCDVPLNYIRYNYIDWRKPDPFSHIQRALDHPAPDPADPTTAEEQAYLEWLYQTLNRILAAKIIFSDPTNPDPIRLYSDRARGAVDALFEKTAEFNPMYDAFGLDDLQEIPASEYADFAHAIKDFNGRLLLLGEPGAGKSITLLHEARVAVVQRLVDKRVPLPVFGNIAFWNAYDHDSWLPWLKSVTVNMLSDVADWLKRGDLIIFADGLDELGSTKPSDPTHPDGETFDPRLRFMEQLPPDNRVLVSCRVKDYAAIGAKIKLKGAVTLRPLSLAQITDFLRKMPPLLEAIQRDSRLREMVETPLLLSLFAAGYRDSDEDDLRELADLAASPGDLRDKIFERYVHDRYRHEANKYRLRREAVPYTLEEVYDRLGYVAVLNAVGGWGVEDNVLDDDYNGALDADFAAFALQLDLVRPLPDKEGLGFVHLRLRDYMAYTWGLMPPDNARLLTERELDTRLLILRMLERVPDERAVPALMEALNGRDRWVRRGAVRTLGQFNHPSIFQTLITALHDNDAGVRRSAVLALVQKGNESAIPHLIGLLEDPDGGVTAGVIVALAHFDNPDTRQLLTDMLISSTSKKGAADVLQQIGWTPTSVDEAIAYHLARKDWNAVTAIGLPALGGLIQALNSSTVKVRRAILKVIRDITTPANPDGQDVPLPSALLETIEPQWLDQLVLTLYDSDDTVRKRAASTLEQIGWTPTTIEQRAMYAIVQKDWEHVFASPNRNATLVQLLDTLGKANSATRTGILQAIRGLDNEVTLPVLLDALDDSRSLVKIGVIEALGHIKHQDAVHGLIRALDDENVAVQRAAILALGNSRTHHAVSALIERLNHSDSIIRQATATALGNIKNASAIQALTITLHDEVVDVRRVSANALGNFGEPSVVPILTTCLNDPSPKVRMAVLKALGKFNDPSIANALLPMLQDEHRQVRQQAVDALAVVGGASVVSYLLEMLHDLDEGIQKTAIGLLGKHKDPAIAPALIQMLDHTNTNVQSQAVVALGNIGDPIAIPALSRLLADPNTSLRRQVVTALQNIGTEEIVPALKIAARDENAKVHRRAQETLDKWFIKQSVSSAIEVLQKPDVTLRRTAVEKLGELRDADAIPALIQILKDPDSWMRNGAAWALGSIGHADAIPALIQTLRDDDSGVRYSAGQALKLIDTNAAIPALIEVFKEQDWRIRRDAAKTLIQLGEEALPALVEALSHRNTRVRANAAEVLGQIGNPSVVPALVEALRDKAKHGNGGRVCDSAATALEQIGTEEALEAVAAWEQTPIGKQRRP